MSIKLTPGEIMQMRVFSGEGVNVFFDKMAFARAIESAVTARVLEAAAKRFDSQPHVEMFRPDVAAELRALAKEIAG